MQLLQPFFLACLLVVLFQLLEIGLSEQPGGQRKVLYHVLAESLQQVVVIQFGFPFFVELEVETLEDRAVGEKAAQRVRACTERVVLWIFRQLFTGRTF